MTQAVFFDLYQTLVGYNPPREEWESQMLDKLGIKASPQAFNKSFTLADEYFYSENAKKPLSKRPSEDVAKVYFHHQSIVLKEGGIEPAPDLVRSMLARWRDTKLNHVLFNDVLPSFTELKRMNMTLGLISNVDKDITGLLDDLGLSSFLTTVVTSQETGFTKPHPEIFQEALRRVEIAAEDVIFVGDQYKIDVLGATAAGMKGILVDRGGFSDAPAECPRVSSLFQITSMLD
ncbi:2-haloalkanoic acid dehalogenase [Dehalogenimonas sp. WBC-2]|nr:2-haloalkanoic acid dehalogenase [Dehalogenimonas sp. WBC-2]